MGIFQTSCEALLLLPSEEVHLEGTHIAGPRSSEHERKVANLRSILCHASPPPRKLGLSGVSALLQKEDPMTLLEKILETFKKGGPCERERSQRSKKIRVGNFTFLHGFGREVPEAKSILLTS